VQAIIKDSEYTVEQLPAGMEESKNLRAQPVWEAVCVQKEIQ